MKRPVHITGAGLVTPAGLDARQTSAAIRASLGAFQTIVLADPPGAEQIAARVPAARPLKLGAGRWLVNLAARALREAFAAAPFPAAETVVFLTPPEADRDHPAYREIAPRGLPAGGAGRGRHRRHPASRAVDGGPAAGNRLIPEVSDMLGRDGVGQVLLGGVDSLLDGIDNAALRAGDRLAGETTPQGVVPAEGAAFLRLSADPDPRAPLRAAIAGVGVANEPDHVRSDRQSQGRALLAAMRAAVSGAGPGEPDLHFVVSNGTGERFFGLEILIARPRFFRTRRPCSPSATPPRPPAISARPARTRPLRRGRRPHARAGAGPAGLVEVISDAGLRAAATVVAGVRAHRGMPEDQKFANLSSGLVRAGGPSTSRLRLTPFPVVHRTSWMVRLRDQSRG